MTATAAREYGALLMKTVPTVIRTKAENEAAIRKIEELAGQGRPSAAERKLMELLTVLVEAFEEEHYPLSRNVPPVEALKELMAANGLKQKDLTDVFGTPSIVSEVIHGRRNLTTEHIRKLSERFHVSTDLFF
jgi:HTH-type transcriptional regulator / antitoxin HigA